MTPKANAEDQPETTRMAGRINVRIHEFDDEGGEHTRLVGVPLDIRVPGHINYQQKTLVSDD